MPPSRRRFGRRGPALWWGEYPASSSAGSAACKKVRRSVVMSSPQRCRHVGRSAYRSTHRRPGPGSSGPELAGWPGAVGPGRPRRNSPVRWQGPHPPDPPRPTSGAPRRPASAAAPRGWPARARGIDPFGDRVAQVSGLLGGVVTCPGQSRCQPSPPSRPPVVVQDDMPSGRVQPRSRWFGDSGPRAPHDGEHLSDDVVLLAGGPAGGIPQDVPVMGGEERGEPRFVAAGRHTVHARSFPARGCALPQEARGVWQAGGVAKPHADADEAIRRSRARPGRTAIRRRPHRGRW
jgi:hypothetical protein